MNSAKENIVKWLADFRARDKEHTSIVEVDLTDEEHAKLLKAATSLGMTFDEYCNYALEIALFSKVCPTCRSKRLERSTICENCGEID
jgi:hypothetical protein